MANPENLIPAKPGEVRNPNGKPKGTRNRSTILREVAELVIAGEGLDGSTVSATAEEFAMVALMRKAISGDVSAIKELNDTLYGKVSDKTEITNPDGSMTPQAITVKVVTKKE